MTASVIGWVLLVSPPLQAADSDDILPGTKWLSWNDNMPDRLMDGAHRYLERRTAVLARNTWPLMDARQQPDLRLKFAKMIGVVDPRSPPAMERFGTDANPALVAETKQFTIHQVHWPVLGGVSPVTGEGLLLTPKKEPVAFVVALPDAVWTPEDICGLTCNVPAESQYARHLAEAGFMVIVPVIIDRATDASGNPAIRMTNKPHREWIYHMAYHMGRHVIGYDVQRTLGAIDWIKKQHGEQATVGVMGVGEGGLVAQYAAAIDPRIQATLVSGYYFAPERLWRQPIYRNLWRLLELGGGGVAGLIAPRGLVIEHSPVNEIKGRRDRLYPDELAANEGRAAGGELLNTNTEYVNAGTEYRNLDGQLQTVPINHVFGERGGRVAWGSAGALRKFAELLNVKGAFAAKEDNERNNAQKEDVLADNRKAFDPAARQRRQVKELENHVQWLLRNADRTRDAFFLDRTDRKNPDAFVASVNKEEFKKYLAEEIIGRIDERLMAPNPRSRKIYDRPKWRGYEIVLDVVPDIMAYGILLLPKDMKPGERRPVVVCQHGRNGVPQDTIEGDNKYYHDFSAKLAERGFIVFAPHNLYRTEQRYRWLQRKANPLGLSMFSFITIQHDQILRWLASRPEVDPKRIAFYGLSYGGETAVRVPPLLDGYCLSICSADFNDWARRVADSHSPYGYPFYDEWEMPYFNMGNTFNYAELTALMVPRPFMVERGHWDGVGPDEWVAYEYAKVKRLYDQLGIGDRTEIEFFNGPHTINGVGTFKFLHKHLNWPEP